MKAETTSTVLIVDDEPRDLDVLNDCLHEFGYRVLVATDGEQALERVGRIMPDLILLDVGLPGMDGFELCRRLKVTDAAKDVPIIFITGGTDILDKLKGLRMSAVDYITKPFQSEEVVARVEKHLLIRNMQKRLEEKNLQLQEEIIERKRAQEEKMALERRVHQAQKLESLGVLAGGIAHDFNNLLMCVLGYADLALAELPLVAPVRRRIFQIIKAGKRAGELTKQMLAYSGRGKFVVEPLDFGELVEEMVRALSVSIGKTAVLKYDLSNNLPTFEGDVTQIRQIIMNLIINASEAIDGANGVITLSTGKMECERAYLDDIPEGLSAGMTQPLEQGTYVWFEVADTGCGMEGATVEKIFDPFFTTKFAGRGLGMSATLGIVRGHKGAIKISSEVGIGSTFRVLFPAKELPSSRPVTPGPGEGVDEGWKGKGTILVVDDEEPVRTLAELLLKRMGFEVLTAPDGRQGVAVFREHAEKIVCVLLDLTMPHMDGAQAFREMNRTHPGVKVVLCSGYDMVDATEHFAKGGLAGFLQKPFEQSALQNMLRDVLRPNPAPPGAVS